MTQLGALPEAPTVAAVIPVRNGAATLASTLDAVLRQDLVSDVVLAVGPSSDGTERLAEELATEHAAVRVVPNPSGHTPDGLNRGVAATTADVVVRVDAHAVLPDGYVRRAVRVLRETGAANVGGRQVPVADGGFAAAVAAAMASPLGTGGAVYRSGRRAGPADTVYLGVFRRDALEAVGAFDTRFRRNQDAELNVRLRRAGLLVWFDPELAVHYRPRGRLSALVRQYFEYGRYRRLTARTHPGSLQPRQLAAPALVVGTGLIAGICLRRRSLQPLLAAAGTYGVALVVGARPGPSGADDPDIVVPRRTTVALALAAMHASWGVGFLVGPPRPRDR